MPEPLHNPADLIIEFLWLPDETEGIAAWLRAHPGAVAVPATFMPVDARFVAGRIDTDP